MCSKILGSSFSKDRIYLKSEDYKGVFKFSILTKDFLPYMQSLDISLDSRALHSALALVLI